MGIYPKISPELNIKTYPFRTWLAAGDFQLKVVGFSWKVRQR